MSDNEPPTLFHFTCDHGYAALGQLGELRPLVAHPFLGCKVVWLTSEAQPDRETTGLGQHYTSCDRMQYRYVVLARDRARCRAWLTSPERWLAPEQRVTELEEYGDPEHWWITDGPTLARLTTSGRPLRSGPRPALLAAGRG